MCPEGGEVESHPLSLTRPAAVHGSSTGRRGTGPEDEASDPRAPGDRLTRATFASWRVPGSGGTSIGGASARRYRVRVSRIDRASAVVAADPARVYAALVDADALVERLPPAGMSARFDHFDAQVGGGYRLVLTYAGDSGSAGKTTADSDVVEARWTELVPGNRVVQAVRFESEDPAFAGTMTMTWSLEPVAGDTRVELRAEDVPPGISAEDHAAGLESSLRNLADFLSPRS